MEVFMLLDTDNDLELLERGRALDGPQAQQLEQRIEENENSLAIRLQLIGHYFQRKPGVLPERFKHVLWLIHHAPEKQVWREIALLGTKEEYPSDLFSLAKQQWLREVECHIHDASTIGNAGIFLIERDFETGDRLLETAAALDESDYFWLQRLAWNRFFRASAAPLQERSALARNALLAGQRFLKVYEIGEGRISSPLRESALEHCALAAFWSDELLLAKQYAERHLELIARWSVYPKFSRSLLGLISLRDGDIEGAKEHLLFVKRQSRMDSLDLQLSNELIKMGQVDVVVRYLKKCRKLGQWTQFRLDEWIVSLESGTEISLG
jgi:hypothetical protein